MRRCDIIAQFALHALVWTKTINQIDRPWFYILINDSASREYYKYHEYGPWAPENGKNNYYAFHL